jgi:hypothetical protein
MRHRFVYAALTALVCLSGSAAARGAEPVAEAPATVGGKPQPERLLVLASGRVVSGTITQSAGGYVVEKPNGNLLVPFEQVRLEAADLPEAYRKLRATMKAPTATHHVGLAQWCLTNQLFDPARAELREALLLEPNRGDIRTMLQRLEEILDPKATAPVAPPPQPLTADGFEPPESSSLAGLPEDAAHEFVAKVQPILLNKCGNASCHAATSQSSSFRLTAVHSGSGSHRVFVERNLAAVLRLVDPQRPDASPLLTVPRGNHGRAGRTIFYGARGDDQLALLREWVRAVAASQPKQSDHLKPTSTVTQTTAPQQNLPVPVNEAAAPEQTGERNTERDGDDARLQALLRERPGDRFDPDIFNRAVHGRKRENP